MSKKALWDGFRYLQENQPLDIGYFVNTYRIVCQFSDGIRTPIAQIVVKEGGTGRTGRIFNINYPLSLELSAASLRIFKWNGVYDSNKIYFISAASLKTLSYSMSGETLCLTLRTDESLINNFSLFI